MAKPKRLLMKIKLSHVGLPLPANIRLVSNDDVEAIGEVMLEAYRNTIDSEGETLEDAIGEVQATLNGKYGPFLKNASLIAFFDKTAAAAILFTWSDKEKMPLLAFSMTHAKYKGQGFAKKLIKLGLDRLSAEGNSECCLVVTEGNEPAFSIYKDLGFLTVD